MITIRKYCLYLLLAVTPAGFVFKLYAGPARWWFNDYGAGLLYEIFWILIAFFVFPEEKLVLKIPLCVFIVTCTLEILQLWDPRPLHFDRVLPVSLSSLKFFHSFASYWIFSFDWVNQLQG